MEALSYNRTGKESNISLDSTQISADGCYDSLNNACYF